MNSLRAGDLRLFAVLPGARALYLYRDGHDTFFRLHGTSEPESIGQAVSSGCIRLFNQDIIDLYNRVPVGARVTVVQG